MEPIGSSLGGNERNAFVPPNTVHVEDDNPLELLMRHSSPFSPREGSVTSPLTERHSSPSFSRPRSNPRNRTPMRYQSPLQSDAFRIPEGRPAAAAVNVSAGISSVIRPTAGRAVGTTLRARAIYRNNGIAEEEGNQRRPLAARSQKQGPSHRKVRRWNNDNFVNLAAEINSGNKGGRAAQALLLGQADASLYRAIINSEDQESKVMKRLREDEGLNDMRDQFFAGELSASSATTPRPPPARPPVSTPEEMLMRIESRLRRVVVKACENSMPASKVIEYFEIFLVRAHRGKKADLTEEWWKDILIEPPSSTHRKRDNTYITRFLFDGESPNGGFHRLLLHGLCQFHGLKATSSSMQIMKEEHSAPVQARLLVATGTVAENLKKVKMADYIALRKQQMGDGRIGANIVSKKLEDATSQMQALKVLCLEIS